MAEEINNSTVVNIPSNVPCPDTNTIMRRDLAIILQLGFGFFTIFSAFNSQGFIEIAVLRSLASDVPGTGITANSGYYSLSIIYFVFTAFNLVVPPLITKIGAKWAMVLGALCYSAFMTGFLWLSAPLLYFLSGVLGFGAAVLWTGNGVYLVKFSREGKMARNSGIMWAMLQTSLVAGALFLFFVLRQANLVSSYRLVYTVFSAVSLFGVVILATLPSAPLEVYSPDGLEDQLIANEERDSEPANILPSTNWSLEFVRIFSLLKTRNMIILSICFMFSGLEMTFFTGVYSACLSATTALNKGSETIIAFNALAMGAGQIVGGLWFGLRSSGTSKLGRSSVIIFGMILHVVAFFMTFLNIPAEAPLHKTSAVAYIEPNYTIALATGSLLGLADSCWNTQIYTLLGRMYKNDDSSPAFALFKFFQSLAACASFYYGGVILLHWQLLILVIGAAMAALSFFTVHGEASKLEIQMETAD